LGVVSRKPALSEAEGDLLLLFEKHLGYHPGRQNNNVARVGTHSAV
jgi:hypothetical protein